MYNPHRGLGPAPGNSRLNELLEGIRAEFESQARASGEYEHSSKKIIKFQAEDHNPFIPHHIIYYTHEKLLTTAFNSCATNKRDANGSRKGLCYGTDTHGPEAKVRRLQIS